MITLLVVLAAVIFVGLIIYAVTKSYGARLNEKMEEYSRLVAQGVDPRDAKRSALESLRRDFERDSASTGDLGMKAYRSLQSHDCQSCGKMPALFQDRSGLWCRRCAMKRLCQDERVLADTVLGALLQNSE